MVVGCVVSSRLLSFVARSLRIDSISDPIVWSVSSVVVSSGTLETVVKVCSLRETQLLLTFSQCVRVNGVHLEFFVVRLLRMKQKLLCFVSRVPLKLWNK